MSCLYSSRVQWKVVLGIVVAIIFIHPLCIYIVVREVVGWLVEICPKCGEALWENIENRVNGVRFYWCANCDKEFKKLDSGEIVDRYEVSKSYFLNGRLVHV